MYRVWISALLCKDFSVVWAFSGCLGTEMGSTSEEGSQTFQDGLEHTFLLGALIPRHVHTHVVVFFYSLSLCFWFSWTAAPQQTTITGAVIQRYPSQGSFEQKTTFMCEKGLIFVKWHQSMYIRWLVFSVVLWNWEGFGSVCFVAEDEGVWCASMCCFGSKSTRWCPVWPDVQPCVPRPAVHPAQVSAAVVISAHPRRQEPFCLKAVSKFTFYKTFWNKGSSFYKRGCRSACWVLVRRGGTRSARGDTAGAASALPALPVAMAAALPPQDGGPAMGPSLTPWRPPGSGCCCCCCCWRLRARGSAMGSPVGGRARGAEGGEGKRKEERRGPCVKGREDQNSLRGLRGHGLACLIRCGDLPVSVCVTMWFFFPPQFFSLPLSTCLG